VKNKGRVVEVEMSVRIIRATPRFSAPVYFLPGGDRRSDHTLDGWLKEEEEPAVKHIASGKVVSAAKKAVKCTETRRLRSPASDVGRASDVHSAETERLEDYMYM